LDRRIWVSICEDLSLGSYEERPTETVRIFEDFLVLNNLKAINEIR